MKVLICFVGLLVSSSFAAGNLPEVNQAPRGIALRSVADASANLVQVFKLGPLKQNRYKVDLTFLLGSDVDKLATLNLLTQESIQVVKLNGELVSFHDLNASYLSPRKYEATPAKPFIASESGKEQKLVLPLLMTCVVGDADCVQYVAWTSHLVPNAEGAPFETVYYRLVLQQTGSDNSFNLKNGRIKLEPIDPKSIEFLEPKPVGI